MLIKNDFEVAEPVEKAWQFLDNIPQVAACLPGAELTEDLGDDKYKGKVAVRMGPVRMQFAGTADITERDDAAKRIVVHAAGADEKGRGGSGRRARGRPRCAVRSRCRAAAGGPSAIPPPSPWRGRGQALHRVAQSRSCPQWRRTPRPARSRD